MLVEGCNEWHGQHELLCLARARVDAGSQHASTARMNTAVCQQRNSFLTPYHHLIPSK